MFDPPDNRDRKIEDVIDARKKKGHYDVIRSEAKYRFSQGTTRYAYSAVRHDEKCSEGSASVWYSEGDNEGREASNVGPTDSEVTVVRVKMDNSFLKTPENNWNMKDDAIPGDGTHLGESPSLVNLVTLVRTKHCEEEVCESECKEYLVPLSSWDPTDKPRTFTNSESEKTSSQQESLTLPQVESENAHKKPDVRTIFADSDASSAIGTTSGGVGTAVSADGGILKAQEGSSHTKFSGKLKQLCKQIFKKKQSVNIRAGEWDDNDNISARDF